MSVDGDGLMTGVVMVTGMTGRQPLPTAASLPSSLSGDMAFHSIHCIMYVLLAVTCAVRLHLPPLLLLPPSLPSTFFPSLSLTSCLCGVVWWWMTFLLGAGRQEQTPSPHTHLATPACRTTSREVGQAIIPTWEVEACSGPCHCI